MSEPGSVPGPVVRARARSRSAPDQRIAVPHGHHGRDGHAPLAGRTVARRRSGRRRRRRDRRRAGPRRGSWRPRGPGTACRPRWPARTRGGPPASNPTKETAATSGWSRSASTATESPFTTVNTPSGSPASRHSSATRSDGDGSRSDGLRMNVLPQAMATGYIHMGTITGKLNGVIPATTPRGWRIDEASTPVGDVLGELPLQQMGDAAGELDHLDPPGHLAPGVLDHLAVLVGDQPGQVVAVPVGELAEGEEDAGPAPSATCPATRRRRPATGPRPGRRRPPTASTTSRSVRRVAGSKTGAVLVRSASSGCFRSCSLRTHSSVRYR